MRLQPGHPDELQFLRFPGSVEIETEIHAIPKNRRTLVCVRKGIYPINAKDRAKIQIKKNQQTISANY